MSAITLHLLHYLGWVRPIALSERQNVWTSAKNNKNCKLLHTSLSSYWSVCGTMLNTHTSQWTNGPIGSTLWWRIDIWAIYFTIAYQPSSEWLLSLEHQLGPTYWGQRIVIIWIVQQSTGCCLWVFHIIHYILSSFICCFFQAINAMNNNSW